MYQSLVRFIWNESFWIPSDLSWSDYESTKLNKLPRFHDPWIYPFLIAFVYVFIDTYIVYPIFHKVAHAFDINNTKVKPPKPCPVLEKLFVKFNGKIPRIKISQVAEDLQWQEIDVHRWIYAHKNQKKQTKAEKFAHKGIEFIHHTCYGVLGFVVVWGKPWFWDLQQCYAGYPFHPVSNDIWWYYMISLGFFWFLCINHIFFSDNSKMDLMFTVHHGVTIILMSLSWNVNLIRIGSVVLFIHYLADAFLLAAKLGQYANLELFTDIFFVITFLIWIITRSLLFPFWVIRSIIYEAPKVNFMPAAYLFYGCIFIVQLLNYVWLGMFINVAYKKLVYGKLQDVRSSDEEDNEALTRKID